MTIDSVTELGREATLMALKIGGPVLVVAVFVGLTVSMLQAATQIQDQTLSIVPKIAAVMLALLYLLPWMLSEMVDYSTDLMTRIPTQF